MTPTSLESILIDIPMPQMGESITEATIVKWHKSVGDSVRVDETVLEISTAKVEAEIPSPCDGIIVQILYNVDDTVDVDTIIARIAPPGTPQELIEKHTSTPGQPKARKVEEPEVPAREPFEREQSDADRQRSREQEVEIERERLLRRRSTPLVRSMLRELGIDASLITGTGSHGRITKDDVLRFLEQPRDEKTVGVETIPDSSQAPPPVLKPPRKDDPLGLPVGGALTLEGQRVEFGPGLGDLVEPMTTMRRAIGRHMIYSLQTSPHAYTVFEADMTNVVKLRQRLKDDFEATYKAKLTPLAFLTRAVVEALIQYPILNSSVDDKNNILYHRQINIGIAVAVKEGLIVPVIRNCELKTIPEIAIAISDLATRARNRQLKPHEVEGGTFTISSPGAKGSLMGMPIISQPQIALIHMGGIQKRVVAIEDADGNDIIAIRHKVIMTLALDHRVIDGWVCDSFMASIRDRLESGQFDVMDDGS
jgi:pyruvate dehydrogenase E2 component (dihydrolipoamide acetyltransferase)